MDFAEGDGLTEKLLVFARLYNVKVTRRYAESFRDLLTPLQFLALSVISAKAPLTMTALCEQTGIKKQYATKLVEQLVALNYAERMHDPQDRRVVLITLTPYGREFFESHLKENMGAIDRLFDALSKEELADLESALGTLNKILDKLP